MTIAEPKHVLVTGTPSPQVSVSGSPGGPARLGAWLGVLVVAGVGAWLGVVGLQALLGADDLSSALGTAQGRTVGPALIAVVLLLVLAERRWPAVPRPLLARAHLVDAGYLAIFAVVVVPLLTVVETGFAIELTRHARFVIIGRLSLVPQVVVVAVILIAIDGMNWAAHLANHRSAALWRLHALHHSQEDMGVLTTFRTHPLVHATYLGALLPALVLGASGTVPGVALVVYGCLVTLPHANLGWTFGPLGRLAVSPAYHRLHHAAVPFGRAGHRQLRLRPGVLGPDGPARTVPDRRRAGGHRNPGSAGPRRAVALRPRRGTPGPRPAGPAVPDAHPPGRSVVTALTVRARHATEQLQSAKESPLARDAALVVVRVALAWIFVYHGAGTLFGAFGQPGIHGHAIFFANVAHLHPGTFFAVLSGIIEFFGGLAVGVGLLGRLAASGLVGDMVIAMVTVTWHNGIVSNAAGSGYELNIALAALAMVIVLLGTGRYSLDVVARGWLQPGRDRP